MAAPIDIDKNCFYRKHNITTEGAMELRPSLTDSSLSGTRDFNLKGGTSANIFLLSGATPPALTYGDGALIGGDLVLYCSGTELSSTGAPPIVDLFAAVSGTSFKEGDMELSHGWENLTSQSGSVVGGASVLNGTGTTFMADYAVGDDIKIVDAIYTVASITSDTELSLNTTIGGGVSATSNNLYKPRFYGDEIAVYTAHADRDLYTYSETFDGGQNIGTATIAGFKVSEPYIKLNSENGAKLASSLYAGGNYSLTYGLYLSLTGEDAGPSGSAFFQDYFGTLEDNSRSPTVSSQISSASDIGQATLSTGDSLSATKAARDAKKTAYTVYANTGNNPLMYIKPLDESKLDDLWVPANDYRDGMENIFAFTPYWRWKDIKHLVQYRKREKTEVEESEDVNSNNTIFDSGLIYASPNLSSFYGGGDSSGLPVNKSIIQISNEAYAEGGSSLQMYNLWSYSTLNAYTTTQEGLDPMYGVSGAANPQFCCVGMKNVPFPQQIDNAFNVRGRGTSPEGEEIAWDNATLPEINIKFNVKEMDVVPTIASTLTDEADQIAKQGVFTDYWGANLTAGTAENRYTDSCLVSGTKDWVAGTGPFDFQFRTLMRNFTICFSNYPPSEGEGLDSFIHRGLKDYYSGTTAGNKFIGGLTVFRDRTAKGAFNSSGVSGTAYEKGDGNVLTAMPLQCGQSNYAYAPPSTGYGNTVLDISAARNRILKFNNAQGTSTQSADLMCFAGVPSNDGNVDNATGVYGTVYEQSVNLAMDQFVNVKFVFNTLGGSSAGLVGAAADSIGAADQCRVYFTDGVIKSDATAETEGSDVLSAGTVEEPVSLPILFPTSKHNSNSGLGQTWLEQPSLWPRYMTLWVTNYRQTNFTTGSTDNLQGEQQPWSAYTGSKVDFGITSDYPSDTGSDKQTNVFVDNIHFSNFTNAVHNASVKSVGKTDNIVINSWPTKSPIVAPPQYDDFANQLTTSAAERIPGTMLSPTLHKYFMPTYVLLGFDNGPADFYASGGADPGTTQWYQWHGFGTPTFSNLEQQDQFTTTHNMSWYRHADQAGLMKSYGNYLQNSYYSYAFFAGGKANKTVPTYAAPTSPTRGFLQTVPTFTATQPTVASNETFNFATGSATNLFTDGLTQKGFTQFGAKGDDGSDNDYDGSWLKREHPFVAAKITSLPSVYDDDNDLEKNVIEVDRGPIFDMPLDDEYIIYTVGGGTGSLRPHANIIAEGSSDNPYFDYDAKTMSPTITWSGSITASDNTMDIVNSTGLTEVDPGFGVNVLPTDYLHTGAYLALHSGSIREIVRIEGYIKDGGASGYDRMTISRAQMNTTAAARIGTAYTIRPIINVFSLKGITQRKQRDGNKIFLNAPQLDSIVNEENLPYLYISPYKYWQWFQMWPGKMAIGEPASATTNTGFAAVEGTNSGPKAFSSISLMKSGSAVPTATGTTYSEEEYTFLSAMTGSIGRVSPYNSLWNLDTAASGSSIVTNVDYGLGPYTEDTRTGGQVTSRGVYSQNPMAFNLDGLVNSRTWGDDEEVVNKLVLAAPLLSSSAVFYGNDYTTTTARAGISAGSTIIQEDVKPYYLWKYYDPVPSVSNFTVGPAFNLLDRETNLYDLTNENLSAVKFNWSESGEDIWYRMLIVDNRAVTSKYHGFSDAPQCLFYGAMNDMPTSVTSAPTLTFKETTTDTTYGTTFTVGPVANSEGSILGTGARMSPEGLQGYAFDTGVSGAASKITITNTNCKFIKSATKYTAIFHLTPGVVPPGAVAATQTVFERGTLGNGGLIITMENGKVKVTMGGIATLVSQTVSPRDGKQPMMIAVVYDKTGDVPCKLFINGKLEDYSITGTTDASEDISAFMCNNTGDSQPYYGLLEEVIFYSNVVHFPDDTGQYILDGSKFLEHNTLDVQSLHSKLFIMDYHNIRGDGKDQVCSTPTVSWRATIG